MTVSDKQHISPVHLPYRPAVGILLLNGRGEAFAGQRIDNPGDAWQMPQGGIDEGEKPLDAAFRELEEEVGTAQAELLAESDKWYSYDLPDELIEKIWGGKYRGQRQKWFVMRFNGRDEDININTQYPEFSSWKWALPEELPLLIVPFKRKLYEAVLHDLASYIRPA